MKSYLIPTSTAERLAKRIKVKTEKFEVILPVLSKDGKRYFPDGEVYMKILETNKLKGKRVVVLHSGAPRPNEGLIELELILQILRDNQVKSIEVFFTYFPYGMQDKVFGEGETNVAENLIEKLISYYGVKKIYVIDPHFGGRKWTKKYCAPHRTRSGAGSLISVSAVPILIEKAEQDFGPDILFFSPDIGGKRRTKISGMKKERFNSYRVKIFSPNLNFKGKIVAVVDDMIKTGGTLLKFYEIAKKSGAKKVIALITHGVIPSGILKIKKKYSQLYLTNTINQKRANLDITDLILSVLQTPLERMELSNGVKSFPEKIHKISTAKNRCF